MALQQINWLQINTENIPSGSQVILASESNPLEWVYTKNLFTSGGFIVSGSLDTSGDVVIGGNLTVKGATTIIESNIVSVGDSVIELNGTSASYGGLIVKDPTQPNTISGSLLWDTYNDKWIGGPLGSEEGFIQETEFNNYTSSINTLINSIVSGFSTNGFIQGGNSFGSTAIIGTNDNQSLILETNGSTRMFVSSSGDIGIGTTSPTEKLEVDGNVKANGFKTPSGTANQALTANGGVFDLNTKADLEGGKVPQSQSQPSTMVMNSSTYVITFTDATGAVQTIDLPLESLFKDANYNETTKSLIVTLQDGTTRTIPLTDLVDLPEIVLATSNPAVTPTTGQKVYFNTSLGKVWFNAGGTWSGGYSLINTLTTAVTSTTTVGAINAGETIPAGTNIQELTELLLNKTFYPTYSNHSFGLTNNAGNSPKEVGSSFNITLTFNFDRGKILGNFVNNIWVETAPQADKLGVATSYSFNGVSQSGNTKTLTVTTISGNNNFNGSVTYATGAQPKDSKNNNFESPFPAGTSPIQSTSFDGIYPYFYYKSLSPITPAIMQSAIANGQATKVLASSTGTITIPFVANGEYIAVAYPATSTTKTIWYVTALDNGEIPGGLLGVANILPCNSPTNLWNNVNFKIHVSSGLITQPNPIQLKNS